jgi:branched-chain amino acid transport system permease protein
MAVFKRIETAIDDGIGRKKLGYIVLGLVVLFFLWFPNDTSQSNYAKTVFISGFFYAIMSSSWALLAGIAGQFSFGHMAFMGIGAYAAGLIARDGIIFASLGIQITPESISSIGAIIIGTVAAGLVGLVIGWLLLRLRAAYLALFTIAFSELFRIAMLTEYDYTGGSNGLSLRPLIEVAEVDTARQIEYYLMFALLIVCLLVMYRVANSPIGLFLRAMREDEDAASALGVNVVRYKILVFVFTSMIVGLAGAVFYSDVGSERIIPEQLEVLQMSLIIAYAVIGGMESLIGAAAGAFIARYMLEAMREVVISLPFGLTMADGSDAFTWETGAWRFALFGLVMVFTLRYMRNGLVYPIISWFGGRDLAMKETVSKRRDDDDDMVMPEDQDE